MERGTHKLLIGDCRESLRSLPAGSVHCCVSSPPYFALRDYGVDGQIGLEPTPEDFIDAMVQVYREVRRVLRDDGVCWVNLGDSYNAGTSATRRPSGNGSDVGYWQAAGEMGDRRINADGYKVGDLMNMPHRVAAALQADGWYWRSTIIWAKRSPMPESVSGWRWVPCRVKVASNTNSDSGKNADHIDRRKVGFNDRWDEPETHAAKYRPCPGCDKCRDSDGYVLRRGRWRPTNAHEYIFLMTKGERYFCDGDAVQEPCSPNTNSKGTNRHHKNGTQGVERANRSFQDAIGAKVEQRNPRNVWTLSSEPFKGSHFATFPSEIPRRAIQASTSAGGCCAACGAQYAPVFSSERVPTRPGLNPKVWKSDEYDTEGQRSALSPNRDPQRHIVMSKISGYRPTCNCNAGVARCVVLDHFAGSGTTGQVATHMGRDFIGCELNPEYAAIAEKRINTPWQPKTEKKPKRAKRHVQPSQKVLFAD